MDHMSTPRTQTARRVRQLLAFAALCATLVAAIVVIPTVAGASSAKVIGKTKKTPNPSCPNRRKPGNCQAVGRVTGFMTIADGKKHPFNVFKDGKIVAWAIDLSKPLNTKKFPQRDAFGSLFKNKQYGKGPTARLSVIKKKGKKGKSNYKLLRQSPVVKLSGALGQRQVITLAKPLIVRKGQVVAISFPTWAPNFASHSNSHDNQWRASRTKDNCSAKSSSSADVQRFVRNSHAQQKVGSKHRYGCLYKGGRLLYWAYYVPNGK
jgi:hypothetical protein